MGGGFEALDGDGVVKDSKGVGFEPHDLIDKLLDLFLIVQFAAFDDKRRNGKRVEILHIECNGGVLENGIKENLVCQIFVVDLLACGVVVKEDLVLDVFEGYLLRLFAKKVELLIQAIIMQSQGRDLFDMGIEVAILHIPGYIDDGIAVVDGVCEVAQQALKIEAL